MSISENLKQIIQELPSHVSLVAVSKTKPLADLKMAYQTGQRIFGENKIQEMTQKWEALPKDISWHMIGNVQTNKIKYMAPYVSLVHGIDRIKVLQELNKEAAKNNRVIEGLLQVHIAEEETKFGFSSDEILSLIDQLKTFKNVHIKGLMGMASFTENKEQVQSEFKSLKKLYNQCIFKGCGFNTLSMGMSGDYKLAIKEGSTLIRVGSKIFGERN
jgi:pyridoxal phosphate enzyme (YggS family)